jgi:hypothetical protein
MKKVLFFAAFFFALGLTAASAQCTGGAMVTAGKSCCASKAAKAATTDATIEKRMADDGTVSYVRKEQTATGSVQFVSVRFDEATGAFVNVAPKTMNADAKAGMVKKTAACTTSEKKACCASGKASTTSSAAVDKP